MRKKLIVFKVECNSKIGFGHFKRCISYSKILIEKNVKIFFLINKNNIVKKIIKHYGIKNFFFNDLQSTFILKKLSKKYQKYQKILIFDSYKINQKILDKPKLFFEKVGYIDDYGLNFNSDFVINYSIENNNYKYSAKKMFLGKKYLPLPKLNIKTKKIIKIKTILLTFGAMDHYDLTRQIFLWFSRNQYKKKFIIIIGPFYKDKEKLKKFFSKFKNTKIYTSPLNILNILKKSDLIVCAGGITVYESLFFNKLVLSIQLWKNQNNTGRNLYSNNLQILKYSINKFYFLNMFKKALIKLEKNLNKSIIYEKKFLNNSNFKNKILCL
jgi:UDP-2,4-diacetamido-2,4,6-trideoxy-beta-L-altropyranose hydrolase